MSPSEFLAGDDVFNPESSVMNIARDDMASFAQRQIIKWQTRNWSSSEKGVGR